MRTTRRLGSILALFVLLLSGCSTPDAPAPDCTVHCGPGTHEQDGLCLPDDPIADTTGADMSTDVPNQSGDGSGLKPDTPTSDVAQDSADDVPPDFGPGDASQADLSDTQSVDLPITQDAPGVDDGGDLEDSVSDVIDSGPLDGQGTTDCPEDAFCAGFEDHAAGAAPDPSMWEVYSPNCSGDGTVIVDAMIAHSGSQSIKVESPGGYCQHVFTRPLLPITSKGTPLYVRFYVRFGAAFSAQHTTFLALHDQSNNKALRMGGQNEILMWNRETDDATLPSLSPTGMSKSLIPPANQWMCIAFMVDGDAGHLTTWVDGALIEGLVVDDEPSQDIDQQWLNQDWFPDLTDVGFGWESYGQVPMTLWYDDIAISSAPINCP